ncbi:MAG: FHA domain-containing protein [Saprospiraceae bacterium]|nr:FHA domain-containing protein [Pyrinomonadaceae bacterium]
MLEITLTFPTPEGSQEIRIDGERTSFGRGSEADHRFADNGLSRLHATIYRDGESVWVVDENSSNGTFVNGQKAAPGGTPLRNGDVVKIGHNTYLTVRMSDKFEAVAPPAMHAAAADSTLVSSSAAAPMSIVPIALIACAILVVSISAVFIGYKVLAGGKTEVVQIDDEGGTPDDEPVKNTKSSPTPKTESTKQTGTTADNSVIVESTEPGNAKPVFQIPSGKTYLDLSDNERRQYLGERSLRVAQVIGNQSSQEIPAAALDKIKGFADAYAKRIGVKPLGGCRFGDNLQVTYERASKNAPFIVRAFNEKATDPRIGLYLAMIESEHCVCLQSPTGPLGMFQFTFSTAKLHFTPSEGVIKGASPSSPDDRCKPEPSAKAAASYMKALTGRYGTGPASVPLAIGSYNSGEGGLSSNLTKALDSNSGLPRDFWTLIANGEMLSKQFQAENFKYVPKFFAAAIIGENPQDFGLKLQPLSTYSN